MSALKIGWFSTARGDSSLKLLKATVESIEQGRLNATIEFVFCSREPGESEKTDLFLREVTDNGLPLVCLSVKKFAAVRHQALSAGAQQFPDWRLEYDREVMRSLGQYSPDICVLAGYMLVVGADMCRRYNMINLHPALPDGPKGTWQEVIWTLIQEQATGSGVMMHLVTPDLDRGPVITFCRFGLTGGDLDRLWAGNQNLTVSRMKAEQGENNELFRAIRLAGFVRETPLILCTLKAFSENRIRIDETKALFDRSGSLLQGYDLTADIDALIGGCPQQ
jgi:phosphoribosylglycinamide formyltransferase-1